MATDLNIARRAQEYAPGAHMQATLKRHGYHHGASEALEAAIEYAHVEMLLFFKEIGHDEEFATDLADGFVEPMRKWLETA